MSAAEEESPAGSGAGILFVPNLLQQKRDAYPSMEPTVYEALRDQLVALLEAAAGLDALAPETRDILEGIRRKALENQFKIVLAGEFQGGKSTTFNALCDGRELSPVGSGIKTSGAILAAQHLADADADESAEVQWRSNGELIAGFSDLLLPHLQHIAPGRFEKTGAGELAAKLDLNDPADRQMITEAVRMEWAVWHKDRAGYDPGQKGLLDVLRSASLIVRYFDDEILRELRRKKTFRPEEIGPLMTFPSDWETRWLDKDPSRFNTKEVVFVFVRHIRLRIHSPALGRLGCVLVDCPGLFASRWDTETARQAMFDADAILYMLDGSKTVKLSDLRALRFIRKNGMGYKLFFGCNMRGHTLADSRRIAAASLSALRQQGVDVPDGDVTLYHALLGLRSVQAGKLLAGTLTDEPTRRKIADNPSDEALARKLYRDMDRQLAILDVEPETGEFGPGFVQTARDISGIDRLMGMAAERVVRRKARAILMDGGARMASESLLEVEGALRTREENALKEEQPFRRQVATVETALRKFRGDCSHILERLDETGPDYALAEDIWGRIDAGQPELADRIGERIYREVIHRFSLSLLVKQRFKDRISAIIKEEIDSHLSGTVNAWLAGIRDSRNPVYNTQIVRRVRSVSTELKQVWEASGIAGTDLMSGVALPAFSGDLELDSTVILRELSHSQTLENVRYNALLAAGGVTGIFTATSGALLAVYLLITRLFWVRIATVVALLVNVVLMLLSRGVIQKSLKADIQRKLEPALGMLFHEIRGDVQTEFRKFSAGIRQIYREAFAAAVDRPRQIFESRRQQAEIDFREHRARRQAIAEEAGQIRSGQIQPLRIQLQEFTAGVEKQLAEAEQE